MASSDVGPPSASFTVPHPWAWCPFTVIGQTRTVRAAVRVTPSDTALVWRSEPTLRLGGATVARNRGILAPGELIDHLPGDIPAVSRRARNAAVRWRRLSSSGHPCATCWRSPGVSHLVDPPPRGRSTISCATPFSRSSLASARRDLACPTPLDPRRREARRQIAPVDDLADRRVDRAGGSPSCAAAGAAPAPSGRGA